MSFTNTWIRNLSSHLAPLFLQRAYHLFIRVYTVGQPVGVVQSKVMAMPNALGS